MNVKSYRRSKNIEFYNLGILDKNIDDFQPRVDEYTKKHPNRLWKMRRLENIISILGHEDKVIDILKIDIEGYEWDVIEDILETRLFSKICHLVIEWHLFPDWPPKRDYVHLLKIISRLK